jgi:hypothetical protein
VEYSKILIKFYYKYIKFNKSITLSNAIVHQFVASAIASRPRAVNDGVKSNNKRTQ